MSDVYQWTGNSNANVAGQINWANETSPGMGTVPGANDVAIIQVGQGIYGVMDVDALDIVQASGAPTISITGSSTAITAASIGIGYGFTLDTGAFLQATDLAIDGSGTAVTVQNGAYLYVAGDQNNNIDIGATSGATNLLITKGAAFTYASSQASGTLNVGDYNGNTTTMTLNGGAYFDSTLDQFSVGAVAGSTGIVNVGGAGTQFLCDDNGYTNIGDFGEQGGSAQGTFNVTGGAYASLVALGEMDIGTSGGMAKVSVSGANSDISAGPYVEIGIYGSNIAGEILVSAGGEFDTATDPDLNNGTISVTGANSLFTGRVLSADAGTSVLISNGGFLHVTDIYLGGSLRVTAGNVDARALLYTYAGSTVTGSGTVTATSIFNSGQIIATGGTLALSGSITGTGAMSIQSGATLQLDSTVAAAQHITFSSGAHELAFETPAGVNASILDFATGEAIDLLGKAATTLSYTSGALTVSNGSTLVAKLEIKGSYTTANFKLATDGHGGELISYVPPASSIGPRPIGDPHPVIFGPHMFS